MSTTTYVFIEKISWMDEGQKPISNSQRTDRGLNIFIRMHLDKAKS